MTRIDWHELSRRAGPAFLAFVVLTWAWAWREGADRPAPDLDPFLKRAWPGAQYAPLPGGAFEVKRDGRTVGYAAPGTASGYSGPLTLAVGTSPEGRIRSLAILEYRDTPDLMRGATKLLSSLLDKGPGDAFEIGRDVDAVTGATFSSRGLALAAQEAARTVAERGMARSSAARARVQLGAPEIVLVLLLAAGAVGRNRPGLSPRTRKLLRAGTLLVSLATLGFLWNRPWVIAFPTRLLAGDWPSWTTHLYWYVLFGSLLLAFNRTGKNAYCPWICPFGAAQDVIGLAGGARKRRIPSALLFTWVKRVLLWLAVLLGLLYRAPGAVSYEVFAAFFRLSGTGFQFAILAIVLVTAVFVGRPFCNWVCPVDTTEQIARYVRVRALRRLGRETGVPRLRRPIRLRVVSGSAPAVPVFRRLRNGVLTAAGLLCALLVLGHLHERLSALGHGAPEGLLGRTFSDRLPPRRRCPRPGTPGTTRPSG
ncbi:MAG TPA: 4Fe-4S binding protein [Vicinamibacteria bacterium]|nr:4Fe-4S binding protein [Vicinamibacteria bacterium]